MTAIVTYADGDALFENLTSPYKRKKGMSNNKKIAYAYFDAIWQQLIEDLDVYEKQRTASTATGVYLEHHVKMLGILREPDEGDASLYQRYVGAYRILLGGVTRDNIIEFVELLLGASPGDVTTVANEDDNGEYKAAHFKILFSFDLLDELGFESSEYTAVIDRIEALLVRVSMAGVKGVVEPLGGGTWGTSTWDGGDVWGA